MQDSDRPCTSKDLSELKNMVKYLTTCPTSAAELSPASAAELSRTRRPAKVILERLIRVCSWMFLNILTSFRVPKRPKADQNTQHQSHIGNIMEVKSEIFLSEINMRQLWKLCLVMTWGRFKWTKQNLKLRFQVYQMTWQAANGQSCVIC